MTTPQVPQKSDHLGTRLFRAAPCANSAGFPGHPSARQRNHEMTTEVEVKKDQVPATMSNLYAQYGLTVASGNTDFLKFIKGTYKHGSANTVLPATTRV